MIFVRTWHPGFFAAVAAALALALAGCTTNAYCFQDCGAGGASSSHSAVGSTGIGAGFSGGTGGDCFPNCSTGTGTGTGCMQTNGGVEICDGIDNDCNGMVDDGIDFASPKSCGTCATSCYASLTNCDPLTITCTPSKNPGKDPGTCNCGSCAEDYYDLDKNGTCEYYCVKSADNDATCDHKDDDCDGTKDEDVDLCASLTDCGKCGNNCVVGHGVPACVHMGNGACDSANTACAIQSCDCNGPGDCWHDIDGSYATGCEYECDPTDSGVEICDGIDNDCDGLIDNADDLSGDPSIGVTCFGSPNGACADAAHAGVSQCSGGKVVCAGPDVLVPNQQLETCNGKDDDCDGVADDNLTDIGGSCGVSNIFPCTLGTFQCAGGALTCVGAVSPGVEVCNGQDDDCDGAIDLTGNMPPMDSVGPCNVPLPPPPGATSPCTAGTKACLGGSIACLGATGPTSANDTCNVDANCDGQLTNQPDTTSDIHNCGACGNDCLGGAVHANWSCVNSACVFQGCQNGYYDLTVPPDDKCEYACIFISAQEACNGVDDNCNGQIDEGVMAPSPVQVCGVSPNASAPECTSGVTVTCNAGAWQCAFPAGVCSPTCAAATEICDGLDNDCNGLVNENVPNYGKPCASDAGQPPPGDGACRTFGTYVCNGPSAVQCSAVKASCATLPGGCTELCDGIDNDCDGLVDEAFNNKGSNPAFFVKPAATKVSATRWIYSYEASRPNATAIIPGSGDGYFTSAPPGVTLDKTPSCSVQGKIPWFDVSGPEVEQVCNAAGGFICAPSDWQVACTTNPPSGTACKWGYAPRGASCQAGYTLPPPNPGKFCNLANSYDFDPLKPGDQDGLLVTGSPKLSKCSADWSGLLGNPAGGDQIYDITGNLRELTKISNNQYNLLGGAFDSQDETGSSCQFTFYIVDQTFKFYDTGFRCCFSADPTL
jgi:Putative metal-binding motif